MAYQNLIQERWTFFSAYCWKIDDAHFRLWFWSFWFQLWLRSNAAEKNFLHAQDWTNIDSSNVLSVKWTVKFSWTSNFFFQPNEPIRNLLFLWPIYSQSTALFQRLKHNGGCVSRNAAILLSNLAPVLSKYDCGGKA